MTPGRALLALVVALSLAVPPRAATAQEARQATGAMMIEGKRVPLPPGAWRVLADTPLEVAPSAGRATPPAALRSVVLGWSIDRRVVALAVLRTNAAPVAGGFGLDPDCRRRDLHMARVETPSAQTLAYCGTIGHVLHGEARGAAGDPAWRVALAELAREGASAPPVWLQVAVRLADQDDLLDVRYLFDPLLLGVPQPPELALAQLEPGMMSRLSARAVGLFGRAEPTPEPGPWSRSGWSARAVGADPARTWVIAQLLDWYEEALPELRQGFKGRGGALAWPRPWQAAFRLAPLPSSASPGLPERVAPPGGELTPETEALWKTLSWRAIGSLLDAGVAYVFTGSAGAASGIAMFGGVVNSAAYYVHELVWRDIGTAGSPSDALTELPEVAIAR
jgi:uncharacterized membrane protein